MLLCLLFVADLVRGRVIIVQSRRTHRCPPTLLLMMMMMVVVVVSKKEKNKVNTHRTTWTEGSNIFSRHIHHFFSVAFMHFVYEYTYIDGLDVYMNATALLFDGDERHAGERREEKKKERTASARCSVREQELIR